MALQQAEIAETGVAAASDDQMVVHRDAEGLRGIDDIARHRDVRLRRRRVARGVVVHDEHVSPPWQPSNRRVSSQQAYVSGGYYAPPNSSKNHVAPFRCLLSGDHHGPFHLDCTVSRTG